MACSDIYDDWSLEDRCRLEIADLERHLGQDLEPLEQRETLQGLSRQRRQLALWKRLFGESLAFQYSGSRDVLPVPRTWPRWRRPGDPFPELEIDEPVGKMLSKRSFLGNREIFFDCPYWWVRWALYRRFADVERAFRLFAERREIASKLARVMKLADRAESVLLELAAALRDCSTLDVAAYMDAVSAPVEKKTVEGASEPLGVGDERLFNWWDLYGPAADLGLLNETAEQIRLKMISRGRRKDVRNYALAVAVGAMWWELAGNRPTSNSTDFGDFLAAADWVFFEADIPDCPAHDIKSSGAPLRDTMPAGEAGDQLIDADVTRRVNFTAQLFRRVETAEIVCLWNRLDDVYLARLAAADQLARF